MVPVIDELLDDQVIPDLVEVLATSLVFWAALLQVIDSVAMVAAPATVGEIGIMMSSAVPLDTDAVATDVEVLSVQGLVDIAQEMEQKFHCYLNLVGITVLRDLGRLVDGVCQDHGEQQHSKTVEAILSINGDLGAQQCQDTRLGIVTVTNPFPSGPGTNLVRNCTDDAAWFFMPVAVVTFIAIAIVLNIALRRRRIPCINEVPVIGV